MDSESRQETGDDAAAHEPEYYDSDQRWTVDASFMKISARKPRERLSTTEAAPARRAAVRTAAPGVPQSRDTEDTCIT
ncbi:hypothetical protein E4U52_000360 [Claviceps spartinae]|nr:hypothetical protein E4U52_000360 [Claviceps spartinae]